MNWKNFVEIYNESETKLTKIPYSFFFVTKQKAIALLKKFLFCESLILRFTTQIFSPFLFSRFLQISDLENFCLYNPIKMLVKLKFTKMTNKTLDILSFRPIVLNLSFMAISYVNITMRDLVIIWLFSNKSTKFFVNI